MDEYDVIIVGSGPAGLTAGIYAGRQGLKTLILDKAVIGGAALMVPNMENYPGYELIPGRQLIEYTKKQTLKYAQINEIEEVQKINIKNEDEIKVSTSKKDYKAKSVILCTGTTHRKLGVKGESEFLGKGVFYCAVCDGPLFTGKRILVVGGGNAAAQGALFLDVIGSYVAIVHRRDELRAEKYLQEKLEEKNIPIIWDTELDEIKGDMLVKSVVLHNKKIDKKNEYDIDGIFIAVGEVPFNSLATDIGVEIGRSGYIVTDKSQRTNMPRIYAAGDIAGGVNQWIVACGEGAVAALSAYEDMQK
ncbi:MAG: FAD-dependent oxidoreductase [Methanobacterium sp.]|uniref:NAD(P)/FAD-dependent oxidoreductase n=1 Tax=Methanobacterium sp. TaxID=2164 RepID=UPI003D6623A6|nr:FAD-dependent oxidoreductase [Methanobacterium sp.]